MDNKVTDAREKGNEMFGAQRVDELRRKIRRRTATALFVYNTGVQKYSSFFLFWEIRQLCICQKCFIHFHFISRSGKESEYRLILIRLKKNVAHHDGWKIVFLHKFPKSQHFSSAFK